jgi:SH2 domain-containing adapter protein B/D/E/F
LEINQKLGLTKPGHLKKDENSSGALPQDLTDLPFDMPKLRRRRATQQVRKQLQKSRCPKFEPFRFLQDIITSGSATSVDLGELPFDMPKLRRRLRQNQQPAGTIPARSHTESSGLSQASSSQSIRDDKHIIGEGGQHEIFEIIDGDKQPFCT